VIKTCSILGIFVLLMYIRGATFSPYLPLGHTHGTEVSVGSVCGHEHRALHPPQGRLDEPGSLIGYNVYAKQCRVKLLCRECMQQDTSRQLLPIVFPHTPTVTQAGGLSVCASHCRLPCALSPRALSIRIPSESCAVCVAGYVSSIDHPPKIILPLLSVV
jgi:hypothetical protein